MHAALPCAACKCLSRRWWRGAMHVTMWGCSAVPAWLAWVPACTTGSGLACVAQLGCFIGTCSVRRREVLTSAVYSRRAPASLPCRLSHMLCKQHAVFA